MTVRTRGDKAIQWIEKFCMVPFGPDRGHRVRLSDAEKSDLRQRYDVGRSLPERSPTTGNLAAYVVLLHLCGPEALSDDLMPMVEEANPWTVWHSAGLTFHPELNREGEVIVCRRLRTRYPAAA